MGYRSDVKIAFYGDAREPEEAASYAGIKLWFEENFDTDYADAVDHYPEIKMIVVSYEGIKWYEDFDFVKKANAAIEKFKEAFDTENENYGACYEMMRLGEEYDDLEFSRSAWSQYRLDLKREIVLSTY